MSALNTGDTHEFACTGPITASVRVGGGIIVATAAEGLVATVTVTPHDDNEASAAAAENTKIEFSGDRLRVETPETGGGWIVRRNGRVRVELGLPLDSRLNATVGSADVRTSGRLGEVTVKSGSGDTVVTETAGNLVVDSGSGDVQADQVGGELRVRTGSGDISATTTLGSVSVTAASGDVRIGRSHGPMRVSTASGDVRIAATQGGPVKVNSASGDVSVGVPAGTRVWLDLRTVSGSTKSDLDMIDAAPEGGAQLSLNVHTVSGDIHIHRA